jgi:predicted AlkP superfamily pyrophosphatase or phosphodiesterase
MRSWSVSYNLMRLQLPLALLAASFSLAAQTSLTPRDRTVIVISLDGFGAQMLADPLTPAPALRRMIAEGATASNGMMPINPTVTWPNHTAIVTGVDATRHGVLYNALPVREPGKAVRMDQWVPKDQLVLAPTVYDLAHQAGLKTAEVDWVAITDAPAIDWSFAEIPKPDAPVVKEMIAANRVTEAQIRDFRRKPITFRDEIWTEAAAHILREHRPNLLLFHLLTTDSAQHRYGAGSLGALAALALADRQVARVLDAVREANIEDRTTVFVVSDHGFATARRIIHPNAILRAKDLLRSSEDCDVWAVPEGGTANVYVTNPKRRAEILPQLAALFKGVEGVSEIITPDEYSERGYPPPGPDSRMSDLVLAAADGYAFDGAIDGAPVTDVAPGANSGNHGYLRDNPAMRAIFIAWGAGIRRGARVDAVNNIDVAPTVAHLLGLKMDGIAGETLTSILTAE